MAGPPVFKFGYIESGAIAKLLRRIFKPSARVSQQSAIDGMFRPVAFGQLCSAAESLTLKDIYKSDGYLRGVSARTAKPGTVKQKLLTILDDEKTPRVLAAINGAASIALLVTPGCRRIQIGMASVLTLSNRLSELRTPYGRDGADQMSSVVFQYRLVSALIPNSKKSDELFLRAVNFQAALSYSVSGFSKAIGSSWIQGSALSEVLQTANYGSGPLANFLSRRPKLCKVLTRFTVVWESLFCVVYLLPKPWAHIALKAVKIFHYGIAGAMELPRFVWGFNGSHGAIEYVIDSRPVDKKFELSILGASAAIYIASAINAKYDRLSLEKRSEGPKGASKISVGLKNVIEFKDYRENDASLQNKPTLVLESGLGFSMDSWYWVIDELKKDFRIVTYHRSGYGASSSGLDSVLVFDRLVEELGLRHVVLVAHSIGSLNVAEILRNRESENEILGVVYVDGSDPDLIMQDRNDRTAYGKFLQSQVITMFAALTGAYKWAPNSVTRQAKLLPDEQFAFTTFVFTPKNIVNAVQEYFHLGSKNNNPGFISTAKKIVLASDEHLTEQKMLAQRIGSHLVQIPGSTHRTILTMPEHAKKVAAHIRMFVNEI